MIKSWWVWLICGHYHNTVCTERDCVYLPDGYLEMLQQKRYSDSTIRMYTSYFRDFTEHFYGTEAEAITVDEINFTADLGHRIYDNATCILIQGDTSTLHIC